jgi:hypothetical protein
MIFRMNRISNRVHTEWKPQNILTGMDRIDRIQGTGFTIQGVGYRKRQQSIEQGWTGYTG